MAVDALIENVQREGLNDAEKADGIAQLKLLLEQSGNCPGQLNDYLGILLGYDSTHIGRLLRIARMGEPAKKEIRSGRMTGKTAIEAEKIAGEEAIPVFAKKKIQRPTAEAIGEKVRAIQSPAIQEKVHQEIIAGKVDKPALLDFFQAGEREPIASQPCG
jgi:hypothetical protein